MFDRHELIRTKKRNGGWVYRNAFIVSTIHIYISDIYIIVSKLIWQKYDILSSETNGTCKLES